LNIRLSSLKVFVDCVHVWPFNETIALTCWSFNLWSLRIRRSPEDLRALFGLIGTGRRSDAFVALTLVENLGAEARGAVPQIRGLIAQDLVSVDMKKRLEQFLARLAREKSAE